MNSVVFISSVLEDFVEIPDGIEQDLYLSSDLKKDIESCIESNDSPPLFSVIFLKFNELDALSDFLYALPFSSMIFQIVLIGTREELASFNSPKMYNFSEFRFSPINKDDFSFIVKKTISVLGEFYKTINVRNDFQSRLIDIKRDQDDLISIGKSLSSERDPDKLLRLILFLSKKITGADAGSIYLVEQHDGEERLRFKYSHTFSREIPLEEFVIPINKKSISGYVAVTGEVLNIPDAYAISDKAPYSFNATFDSSNEYISRSMLVVPMRNHVGEIIGVIQLINSKEDLSNKKHSGNEAFEIKLQSFEDFDKYVVTFDDKYDSLLEAIAGQAAVAIENSRMIRQIQHQFEEFVKASVTAIESRDPGTSGHSFRVARICKEVALAVNEIEDGYLKDFHFSETAVKEIELAALLHDFGKVYVDLAIFQKSKKLYPKDMENLKLRLDFLYRCLELDSLSRNFPSFQEDGPGSKNKNDTSSLINNREEILDSIVEIKKKIVEMNEPAVTDQDPEKVLGDISKTIDSMDCHDIEGNHLDILTDADIMNLSIKRGSLNPLERKEIESHVVHTYNFVSRIPWPPEYRNIPEIALRHHEKLDGSGYPDGLSGRESTSLQSRIMAIADIYDALSASDRPYKKAIPLEKVLSIIESEAQCGKLDPDLVSLFITKKIYEKADADTPLP